MTIKIAYNDLVTYTPRKGENFPGLVGNGTREITAAVKSIWVDEDNGGVTRVSLVGGPDLKFGGVVTYDRKRFTVVTKGGGSIPTPVASDGSTPSPAPVSQAVADHVNDGGEEAPAVVEPTLNKKERTLEIYRDIMARGGKRKEGIATMTSELGMSAAAASTYWQNCKSGKWA